MRQEFKFILLMAFIILAGSLTLTYAQTPTSVAATLASLAKSDFPPPPPDGFRRGPDMLERINLTDEQREQIGLIKITVRDSSRESENRVRAADEQLRMYVESGGFDPDKVKPIIRAKMEAQTAIELARLAADAEINKLLTTEQKAQLAELRDQRPPTPPGGGFGPPASIR